LCGDGEVFAVLCCQHSQWRVWRCATRYCTLSHDDLAAAFRAALRQRGASLAILETAVDATMVALHTEARLRAERRLGEILSEVRERSLRDGDITALRALLAEHGVASAAPSRPLATPRRQEVDANARRLLCGRGG
jgi:hypothetical protein